MKEIYNSPEMNIVEFESEDIIIASYTTPEEGKGED